MQKRKVLSLERKRECVVDNYLVIASVTVSGVDDQMDPWTTLVVQPAAVV